jgi:hypothetical protein
MFTSIDCFLQRFLYRLVQHLAPHTISHQIHHDFAMNLNSWRWSDRREFQQSIDNRNEPSGSDEIERQR